MPDVLEAGVGIEPAYTDLQSVYTTMKSVPYGVCHKKFSVVRLNCYEYFGLRNIAPHILQLYDLASV